MNMAVITHAIEKMRREETGTRVKLGNSHPFDDIKMTDDFLRL